MYMIFHAPFPLRFSALTLLASVVCVLHLSIPRTLVHSNFLLALCAYNLNSYFFIQQQPCS